ncbi:hypothetical protein M0Q28_06040 [Patescibacteria group bacterium]|jgi:hypothetical protein|nr:hypothetical protein [Patescibacteria group bacterium]
MSAKLRRLAEQLRIARTFAVTFPQNQKLRLEFEQLLVEFTLAKEAELEDVS